MHVFILASRYSPFFHRVVSWSDFAAALLVSDTPAGQRLTCRFRSVLMQPSGGAAVGVTVGSTVAVGVTVGSTVAVGVTVSAEAT